MEIQGDLAQMLAGLPLALPDCRIAITQPTIKEIAVFGEDNFFNAVYFLTKTEIFVESIRAGNSRLAQLPDFQLLMVILEEDTQTKNELEHFFQLIFPNYFVRFDPGSINFFLDESKSRIIGQINPMNFEQLQWGLKTLFFPHNISDEPEYNPSNDLAAEIANKLKEGNKKRQQLKQQQNKGKTEKSLFASYISILAIGLSLDINVLYNYTPFQLYNVFIRFGAKVNFDLYQKIATTPLMDASSMKEPKNWMDSIY